MERDYVDYKIRHAEIRSIEDGVAWLMTNGKELKVTTSYSRKERLERLGYEVDMMFEDGHVEVK